MKNYELVLMIHPDQSEQAQKILDDYKKVIEKSGKIHKTEDWGRRALAYEINNLHKAHYVLINFQCCVDVINEIKEGLKFNDLIIRHLLLLTKTAVTEPSILSRGK